MVNMLNCYGIQAPLCMVKGRMLSRNECPDNKIIEQSGSFLRYSPTCLRRQASRKFWTICKSGQADWRYFPNGNIAGTVCFDSSEAFEKLFIRIVECVAKKAVDTFFPKTELKSLKPEMLNFLRTPINYRIETRSTVRGQTDSRLKKNVAIYKNMCLFNRTSPINPC